MSSALDPAGLLAIAEAAVDEVEATFAGHMGARPLHFKGDGDFATSVDVTIETTLRSLLTNMTGYEVMGEEQEESPGAPTVTVDEGPVWVVDPIDGTANYSTGSPLCGILVALLVDARPVVAVSSFPLLGRRVAAAHGGRVRSIGGPAAGFGGGSTEFDPSRAQVGCSSYLELPALGRIFQQGLRPRMTGSVGLDSAFVAQGVFDGAVNFSDKPWDNAAGALLVEAAGGVATDIHGQPWTAHSTGLVVGTPPVHAMLLDALSTT